MAFIKIMCVSMIIKNIPADITIIIKEIKITKRKLLLGSSCIGPFRPDLTGGMNQSEASTSSIKWIAMATVH